MKFQGIIAGNFTAHGYEHMTVIWTYCVHLSVSFANLDGKSIAVFLLSSKSG